ncbi:hypothetical protein EW026_g6799 [Hermanssonia centrifuga]|uniref:Uncharacterized protein n=2 Tax=Hermanssonia centrifuga TaxID=98765 RepID=A0A4S4KBL4_9APHY|nr:hypothetical protein EW026_g6799 [Hermanssonia centrifuga]
MVGWRAVLCGYLLIGTFLLGMMEFALVAMFSLAVAADTVRPDDIACLVLHLIAGLLISGNIIHAVQSRLKYLSGIAYLLISIALLIVISIAFILNALHLAQSTQHDAMPDFATLGAATAYTVLVLSWLTTLLSITWLAFCAVSMYYAPRFSLLLGKKANPPRPLTMVEVIRERNAKARVKGMKEVAFDFRVREINQPGPSEITPYDDWPEIPIV